MPCAFIPAESKPSENLFTDLDFVTQRAFFTERPALAPTPRHRRPALARNLGIGNLLVKDETSRFGSNAFKALGVTYAMAALQARGQVKPDDMLVCASEGNHGRAVARAAREIGCRARVYLSHRVATARVEAIRGEGADVVVVAGGYDEAVKVMAEEARVGGWLVVSDTSWPGYAEIPRLIMLGYTRLMDEDRDQPTPDVIFVPGGVGGLLAAVACWCEWHYGARRPAIVAVEPLTAACLQRSVQQGRPTSLPGPFDTEMGGLRCGEMSPIAFPATSTLVDAFVAIEDDFAYAAMRLLATPGEEEPTVRCGASGAAALGGLLATLTHPALQAVKERLALGPRSAVQVVVTEGVTDPAHFEMVMDRA